MSGVIQSGDRTVKRKCRRPNPNAVPVRFRRHPAAEWVELGSVGSAEAARRVVGRMMATMPGEYVAGPNWLRYVRGRFLTAEAAGA
jgi:hypothetical protein